MRVKLQNVGNNVGNKMALTDLKIKALKPKEKPYKVTDSEGLNLIVRPNGSKYWQYRYRYLGKEQTYAIGKYPEISLTEARNKKFELRGLLRENKNPSAEKQSQKRVAKFEANNTFAGIAKEWHELNKHKWTEKYANKVLNRLENYVFKKIGNKPISQISGLEILEDIIRPIEKEGKTETSHKLLQNCSAIFRLAVLTKRVPYNPLSDLRGLLKPHKVNHLPAIEIKELPKFIAKLEQVDTRPIFKLATKLLLLTFLRTGELRRLKWEYVDFNNNYILVPAHIMKKRFEHIVPLSIQAVKLLEQLKLISGDREYIFPTNNKIKNPYMNENTINKIIKDLGYDGRMVGHGFRSLASTTLNELGYKPNIIERQLAHAERNQVRGSL